MWALVALTLLQAAPPAAAPPAVWNAPLLPEATPADAPGSLVLDGVGHFFAVDLGRALRPRALVLQADGDDVYLVEGSADGEAWRPLWRVPPVAGIPGLRTRWSTLPDDVPPVRHLRVRSTRAAGIVAVSSLRAPEAVPSPWPPSLDHSRPYSAPYASPFATPQALAPLREVVAVLALLAVGWSVAARRVPALESRRARRTLLGAATVLALLSWTNFLNFRYPGFAHHWELFHYYVGAKYFDELRYTGLYGCAALAESQATGRAEEVAARRMRDLATNRVTTAAEALAAPERCTARFTPERWAAFRQDVMVFAQAMGPEEWAKSQEDHGFNATPVWTLTGRAAASLLPATPRSLALLAALDVLLLAGIAILLLRTFGFEAACAAGLFFGLNSLTRFTWTGGAFLRYDWLFAAVLGVCALRAGRPALGGAALAWSALLRIFPGVLLVGVAAGAVGRAVAARGLLPLAALRRVAAGALLAVLALGTASVLAFGPSAWAEFHANSRKYLASQARNFVGAPVLLAYRPSLREELTSDPLRADTAAEWTAGQAEAARRTRPLALALAAAFLVLLAAAASRHEPWVGAVLGAGLLPMALKMANYYYGLLLLYGALWAVAPGAAGGLVALAWASNLAADLWPAYDVRSVAASALVCAFVALVTFRLSRTKSASAASTESAVTPSPAATDRGR